VHHVVDMPARTVHLLHRFLEQDSGRLSLCARSGEFAALTVDDVARIEQLYSQHFMEPTTS
jgi:hypothetical protein